MTRCGGCSEKFICTCPVNDSESVTVFGTGSNSSPYEFRPSTPAYRYAGHAFQPEGGQLYFANTDTRINFTQDALAPLTGGNMWNPALPNRLTAPIDGLYLISAFAARTDGATWNVWVAKNGNNAPLVKRSTALPAGPNGVLLFLSVMTLVRLNAGDYLELYVRSTQTSIVIGEIAVGSLIGVDCCPYLAAQWIGA